MPNVYSDVPASPVQGVVLDNTRRIYNFGDRVAELSPLESPFFVFLSRFAKNPTDDPIFKFLEQRHQWQRRDPFVVTTTSGVSIAGGTRTTVSDAELGIKYDIYGREQENYQPAHFLLSNQVLMLRVQIDDSGAGSNYVDAKARVRITSLGDEGADHQKVDLLVESINGDEDYHNTYDGYNFRLQADAPGQTIGSAFAEGTRSPDGWMDKLFNREGYCQIFKTAAPMFSGSSLATRYRGRANEFLRVWEEKMKEHNMDLELTSLFGVGRVEPEDGEDPKRYSWGIVPYTERYGKVYNTLTYADSTYDEFLDIAEDFFAPETGNSKNKLVLSSRKVIGWLNKLSTDTFLGNTVGASQLRFDISRYRNPFGHKVTMVDTIFGNWHFVEEPLFRGMYEDIAVAVDLKNVAWRPLVGNGLSRDTHVKTNVQENDRDGRKDMILTEAGLEIDLPETHAILEWS